MSEPVHVAMGVSFEEWWLGQFGLLECEPQLSLVTFSLDADLGMFWRYK